MLLLSEANELFFFARKQRNSSAPAPMEKSNPELQQLKTYLDSKRAERLSKQQQRETLPAADNQFASVCVVFSSLHKILLDSLEIFERMESFRSNR